jgi:hypothetical protein
MPNFALQQAFTNKRKGLVSFDSAKLAEYLVGGLKFNFLILVVSAANFKVFQPLLLKRTKSILTAIKTRFKGGPGDYKGEISNNESNQSNGIFTQLQKLKEKSEHVQRIQQNENEALIFSLSFTTNCIISVSFYGLLTPTVVFYVFPALAGSFALDYYRFSKISKDSLASMINQIRKDYTSTIHSQTQRNSNPTDPQHIDFHPSKSKNPKLTKRLFMLKKNKYCRRQRVPATIFVHFLTVLVVMTFPSCLLGYYGLSRQFQDSLILNNGKYQLPNFAKKIYSFSFYTVRSVMSWFSESSHESVFFVVMLRNIRQLVASTFDSIVKTWRIQVALGCYLVVLCFYRIWFSSKVFLSRTQSKIWEKQALVSKSVVGDSFRELNPAYWLKSK